MVFDRFYIFGDDRFADAKPLDLPKSVKKLLERKQLTKLLPQAEHPSSRQVAKQFPKILVDAKSVRSS
jgi:hypothetical protein